MRLLALNMNAKRSTNNHGKEASDSDWGKEQQEERESKTIKGCAWLATDDSQTGGHKEQAKSGGGGRQLESLFDGRALHLTEMNCSARSYRLRSVSSTAC